MSPADFGVLKNMRGYWGENVGNNTYTKFPANVFLVGKSIGRTTWHVPYFDTTIRLSL